MEEIRALLATGNHEFLRETEYRVLDPRVAARLGPDGPFYLSVAYRNLGMHEMERRLLDLARRTGQGVVRDEAELRALEMDLEAGRHLAVLRRSATVEARMVEPSAIARLRRFRMEALFALGRGQELRALVQRVLESAPDPQALLGRDPDLDLFRAVADALTRQPGWVDRFGDLAWYHRASRAHIRAIAFLERSPSRLYPFDAAVVGLLRAKAALAQGKRETAAELLGWALPGLEPPVGSVVVEEAGRLYQALGRPEEGVEVLNAIPFVADDWVRQEFVGRLLAAAGRAEEALETLERSLRESPDPAQRQRAVWQILNLRIERGEREIGRMFREARPYVLNGAYFADILDDAVTVLVAERSWREIEALRDFARLVGVSSIVARADFILARAVAARLIPRTAGRDPDDLLEETLRADPTGYHGLLAAYLTGTAQGYRVCEAGQEGTTPVGGGSIQAATLAEGYLRYGLGIQAYRELVRLGREAPWEVAVSTAFLLQRSGHHQESILLAASLVRRSGECAGRGLLLLMYPALYAEDLTPIAQDRELPVNAVLALVREESAFEAGIVSRAGAVGLTQLMPVTAEEMARRMGLEVVSLTEPVTNLTIGLGVLARLRGLTTTLARAVMAYNAGLSRLRSWERELGRLPEELFVEAVPYDETRTHARKVIVSAVMYGALYDGTDRGSTIELFLPGLSPASLAATQ